MNKTLKYTNIILILFVLLVFASIISLSVGSAGIPLKKIIPALFFEKSTVEHSIILDIRIPRIFLAVIVGGALSVAGVIFQGLFRNPLVEPYTLGISGGAALFISLCIIFGVKYYLPLSGFLGALVSILLVYFISKNRINTMLLIGVMLSFISASAVMFIMAVAGTSELHSIVFWIMGSLGETNSEYIYITSTFILCGVAIAIFYSGQMNALLVGEEGASHLGVNVEKTKKMLFFTASLLTGLSVSLSGIIGFVGLVVPHFMRIFFGSDHRITVIASFLTGGIFLILCDTLARTIIMPMELPVGVITGIIGGVIFIYFLCRRK